jgi:hypothetical protein
MIWNWSSLLVLGADLRGYFGARAALRVFGRWKVELFLTLVDFFERRPCFTAAAAFWALAVAPPCTFGSHFRSAQDNARVMIFHAGLKNLNLLHREAATNV